MRLVLLGAPGSGKGTQGAKISARYDIEQLSTGDILRAAIREKSPLGVKAEGIMARGELVPDDLVVALMAQRLKQPDCNRGYILDGFPRTVGQAKGLAKILAGSSAKLDGAINIAVNDDVVVRRLSGRRQCPKCSAVYHVDFLPPKKSGLCDKCGVGLYQRDDDKVETIQNRLKVYRRETLPLISYYKDILHDVDGSLNDEAVFGQISSLIDKL